MARILIVTTSNARLGDTGKPTGLWLEELATPYLALRDAGMEVALASVKGGAVPLDPRSTDGGEGRLPDPVRRFLDDPPLQQAIRSTASVETMRAADFDAVFLPGGHGTMWDLPGCEALARLVGEMYDHGRIVAAVCHGPAGFVSARRKDGKPLVSGRKVTGFTNAEEDAVGLTNAVPFLLETRLKDLGGHFSHTAPFQPYALRDGNLVSGQNPASSGEVAQLIVKGLREGR